MLHSDLMAMAYPKFENTISIYQEDIWYWIGGISFREFMLGIERPLNVLLLKHRFQFPECDDCCTGLEYVDEDLNSLIADDHINYGDFWWVDFQSRQVLAEIPQPEFLELLYLKQLGEPLSSPYFPTLQNRFAFFSHDDSWALRLWVDSPTRLARVLAQVLTLKYVTFSGRRSLPEPNETIAKMLVSRAEEGLCIDFRQVDAHADSVPIYRVGAVKNSTDAQRLSEQWVTTMSPTERLVVVGDQWHHAR